MSDEIWVVPAFGQGHLLPTLELCKHIASRNFRTTLIIRSDLASNIPSSLAQHPLLQVAELRSSASATDPFQHHLHHHSQIVQGIQSLISTRSDHLPVCAVVDVMMSWCNHIFNKYHITIVGFFTSGACSAAMEYAMWKTNATRLNLKPGEICLLPGLPHHMALTDSDLKTRPHGHGPPLPHGHGLPLPDPTRPPGIGPRRMGPPRPGEQPPWLEETQDSIALMINTCSLLEHPFIDYLADQIGKPVWGVGPLLPEQYWKSAGSILHDHEFRANRWSTFTENEVNAWLDTKPHASVFYISFGSEVGPTVQELSQLAYALEASNRPFIWVIQPGARRFQGEGEGYFPHGLEERVGDRGMIINGWAPQLLILSHPSTGGFLSHCGWNSSVEAIGVGVPILGWPIRGDQYLNAQLIVKHLKVGHKICDDLSQVVNKDDIFNGIERLLQDEDVKKRAQALASQFQQGFPFTSVESLDTFRDFIMNKTKEKENHDH